MGYRKDLIQRKSMIAKQFVDIALTGASYNELVFGPEWLAGKAIFSDSKLPIGVE